MGTILASAQTQLAEHVGYCSEKNIRLVYILYPVILLSRFSVIYDDLCDRSKSIAMYQIMDIFTVAKLGLSMDERKCIFKCYKLYFFTYRIELTD